jgi:hypothetical protein
MRILQSQRLATHWWRDHGISKDTSLLFSKAKEINNVILSIKKHNGRMHRMIQDIKCNKQKVRTHNHMFILFLFGLVKEVRSCAYDGYAY